MKQTDEHNLDTLLSSLKAKYHTQKNIALRGNTSKDDLQRLRHMLSMLLWQLERDVEAFRGIDDPLFKAVWGEKESILTVLTKLSQIFLKTHALDEPSEGASAIDVSAGDKAVIDRFLARRNNDAD